MTRLVLGFVKKTDLERTSLTALSYYHILFYRSQLLNVLRPNAKQWFDAWISGEQASSRSCFKKAEPFRNAYSSGHEILASREDS